MARKLKVYRTPIGFHDALIAASSQKEALRAWGSDVDLFARGVAEVVTDDALVEEALKHPGQVIRRPRGTTEQYMTEADKPAPTVRRKPSYPPDEAPVLRRKSAARKTRVTKTKAHAGLDTNGLASSPKRKPKPKPRPSRSKLDAAEAAIERASAAHDEAATDLRRREQELREERRRLERRYEADIAKLTAALDKARKAFEAALKAWRIDG